MASHAEPLTKTKKVGRITYTKWIFVFLAPFFLAHWTFGVFPILYSFFISLHNWNGHSDMTFVGLDNYVSLFTTDMSFWKAIFNTVVFAAAYIPIVIALGLLLANIVFNATLRGRRVFQVSNFMPYIATPVAVGLLFALLFDWQTGFINNVLVQLKILTEDTRIYFLGGGAFVTRAVVVFMLVWQYLGYYMTMYMAGMAGISSEVYEAAIVDGASRRDIFMKITVPLLKPITQFLVITSTINGLQLYDQPKLLLASYEVVGAVALAGGPQRTGLTAIWHFWDTAFSTRMAYGYGASVSYSLFILILIFSIVGFKFMNRGGED